MKLYFAAPLFNQGERKFNQELTVKLESMRFEVFLPQRDGIESNKPPYDAMEPDARRKAMFELDRDKIREAEIFLFILDGRIPDEGACVELGIAYAQKNLEKKEKILVGLHTDSRAAFLGSKLNPMINVPLDYIASSEEELINFLQQKIF